ncbi:hypothetical protein HID58_055686 [Brassica napus]|uniref:t-SNARE coiled-coil homology domain-containing protein n=1 Tax=Brassica napus TaxID=3708 RepID=A0ABQ8ALY3_BRANA|nr:hypothetical protein HID58_055686 [Brassica napus]
MRTRALMLYQKELDKQVPLMDEMETKVDGATSDLKNTNVRLKQQLVKMRSSRNFCIDIILLCVCSELKLVTASTDILIAIVKPMVTS